jgi:hypothetical protein
MRDSSFHPTRFHTVEEWSLIAEKTPLLRAAFYSLEPPTVKKLLTINLLFCRVVFRESL